MSSPTPSSPARAATRWPGGDHRTFHVGYISPSPSPLEPPNAATSVLLSQAPTDASARPSLVEEIAARPRTGAILFVADLATESEDPSFGHALDLRLALLDDARGSPPERNASYRAAFGLDFAAHGPAEVEAMMVRAGFSAPVRCYQAGLIHGWVVTRR